jgi:hypothetical protein
MARTLLLNGIIHTLDPDLPQAEWLLVEEGRIAALGRGRPGGVVGGAGLEVRDLGGAAVVPAFTDAHVHLASFALARGELSLEGCDSREEVLERVAREAGARSPGQWIRGRGWEVNRWADGGFPRRGELDRAAPCNPVALASKDGHTLWLNGAAMELLGIDRSTPDPPGGRYDRDPETGEPTGIVRELALEEVLPRIPRPGWRELAQCIADVLPVLHSLGITAVHNFEGPEELRALQWLEERGALRLRVLHYLRAAEIPAAAACGLRSGLGGPRLRLGGIKLFADGALGSRSAAMLEPYLGEPENLGILTPEEELRPQVESAIRAGLSVAVHAIGARACRSVLDILEGCAELTARSRPALPHRLEHAQLLAPEDLPRLAELGVVASMQPVHAVADREMALRYWGAERVRRGGYALRRLQQAGTRLIFGSDAPIETIDPLAGLQAAVTMRGREGSWPVEGWLPRERLCALEALTAYTRAPATVAGLERVTGRLRRGLSADLVVLSRDILSCEPAAIGECVVRATMFEGRFVHEA